MFDQPAELEEGAGIEKELDPFMSGQLAFRVLPRDPVRTAALKTPLAECFEIRQTLFDRHGKMS
jgi:hypothetical protein